MTPTLAGRRQTRIALAVAVGVPVCLAYGVLVGDRVTPLALLAAITVLGLGWDALFQRLQRTRWDCDWPPVLMVATGVVEGAALWSIILAWRAVAPAAVPLPPVIDPHLSFGGFAAHYGAAWLGMFAAALGPLRVVSLKWRFRGGELL